MTPARRKAPPTALTAGEREREFWRGVVRALLMLVGVIRAYKLGEC